MRCEDSVALGERARGRLMRRCTMIVLWMLAFAAGMPAWAGLPETPHPRQFTVANGLPSNRINGIAEDQHGYLWIATSDGLARYDGVDFRIWRVEDRKSVVEGTSLKYRGRATQED